MRQTFSLKTSISVAVLLVVGAVSAAWANPGQAYAQSPASPNRGEFSIQVTPSPLVQSVKPGKLTEMDVEVRNGGSQVEELKIEPRGFKISEDGDRVELKDTPPEQVADWISFSEPRFTLIPGQKLVQKVRVNIPAGAGFSYSFALVISRQKDIAVVRNGQAIKGSLAIFTLLNVDKPGATRKLEISKFSMSKRLYEYLPADLTITFKNTGNTIVQPYGDVFFLRKPSDKSQLGSLAVNDKHGYILPGTSRTLKVQWKDGFPVYKQVSVESDKTETKLDWNWANAAHLRIGRYTAKIIAVYNDGQRDVPIEGTISFWVIPWKILLGITAVVLLIVFSVGSVIWRAVRYGRRRHKSRRYSGPQ